jgi:mRNA-degrading endonuclease RelE of RelBE toxin-antitoxin system
MNWSVQYLPEADKDLDSLSRTQQLMGFNKTRHGRSFVLPRRIMDEPMEKEGEYIQTMNNNGRSSGLILISRA